MRAVAGSTAKIGLTNGLIREPGAGREHLAKEQNQARDVPRPAGA